MAYTSGLLKHRVTILNRKGGTAEEINAANTEIDRLKALNPYPDDPPIPEVIE
jgi:hypothetical protein